MTGKTHPGQRSPGKNCQTIKYKPVSTSNKCVRAKVISKSPIENNNNIKSCSETQNELLLQQMEQLTIGTKLNAVTKLNVVAKCDDDINLLENKINELNINDDKVKELKVKVEKSELEGSVGGSDSEKEEEEELCERSPAGRIKSQQRHAPYVNVGNRGNNCHPALQSGGYCTTTQFSQIQNYIATQEYFANCGVKEIEQPTVPYPNVISSNNQRNSISTFNLEPVNYNWNIHNPSVTDPCLSTSDYFQDENNFASKTFPHLQDFITTEQYNTQDDADTDISSIELNDMIEKLFSGELIKHPALNSALDKIMGELNAATSAESSKPVPVAQCEMKVPISVDNTDQFCYSPTSSDTSGYSSPVQSPQVVPPGRNRSRNESFSSNNSMLSSCMALSPPSSESGVEDTNHSLISSEESIPLSHTVDSLSPSPYSLSRSPPDPSPVGILIQLPYKKIEPKPERPTFPVLSARERILEKMKDHIKEKAYVIVFSRREDEICGDDGNTKLMDMLVNYNKIPLELAYALIERLKSIEGGLTAVNRQKECALYLAAVVMHSEPLIAGYIAEVLSQKGIDLNEIVSKEGDTVIHSLCMKGDSHVKVLKELLRIKNEKNEAAFDINRTNDHGKTPLHVAVVSHDKWKNPCLETIRVLLSKGAKQLKQEYKCNKTPLCCAVEESPDPQLIKVLLENYEGDRSVLVNTSTTTRDTPLHYAATLENVPVEVQKDIFNLLLKYGAETTKLNCAGKTPLTLVSEQRKEEIRRIFMMHRRERN